MSEPARRAGEGRAPLTAAFAQALLANYRAAAPADRAAIKATGRPGRAAPRTVKPRGKAA